jgi:hypothetical protein
MKFFVLIRRCGGHEQFCVICRRARDVTDLFISRDADLAPVEDPPDEHKWIVEFNDEEAWREHGWKPRFVEADVLVAEIECLHKVCDEWRQKYPEEME